MSIFSNILNRPLHTLAEASPTTAMDTSHVASVDLSALNSPSTITESPYPEVRNDIIQGGMGNDALYGNEGSDEIYGLGGNDVIRGLRR